MAVPAPILPLLLVHAVQAPAPDAALPSRLDPAAPLAARIATDSSPRTGATADSVDLPGSPVRITFAGQARTRAEAVSNFQLGAGAERRDVYGTTRLVLGVGAEAGPVSLEVEGRHAASHGRDLPGGARRPNDHDAWDVQTARLGLRAGGGVPLSLAVGRQPLSLGRQRLVGVSDWSNVRRAFDGARLESAIGGVTVEAFRARPVVVRPERPNRRDDATLLTGVALSVGDGAVQLYALDYDQERDDGGHRRHTLGARVTRDAASHAPGFDLEGAWQGGRMDGRRVDAWFAVAEVTAVVPLAWPATLTAGVDAASGDRDATDDRAQAFHVPFASSHTHGGYVDVIGRPNVVEARLVATVRPVDRLEVRCAAHRFTRFRMADAVHAKNGSPIPTAAGSRSVGTELDLTATFRAARGLRLLAGYGHFAPGSALRDAPVGAHPVHWGFLGTTYEF